jgi:hypothetical protein
VEFDKFVAEANVTKFADVTNGNGVVTVKNRRMFRDEKIRHDTRLRVARFREKRESNPPCNANVTTPSSSSSSLVSKDTCPQKEIVDLYHEVLPELRKVRIWSEARQKMMRQRWKHSDKTSSLEWWRDFFGYIKLSDFLMGKVKEDFQVDLEWIIRPKNFVKIVEGKYHR